MLGPRLVHHHSIYWGYCTMLVAVGINRLLILGRKDCQLILIFKYLNFFIKLLVIFGYFSPVKVKVINLSRIMCQSGKLFRFDNVSSPSNAFTEFYWHGFSKNIHSIHRLQKTTHERWSVANQHLDHKIKSAMSFSHSFYLYQSECRYTVREKITSNCKIKSRQLNKKWNCGTSRQFPEAHAVAYIIPFENIHLFAVSHLNFFFVFSER